MGNRAYRSPLIKSLSGLGFRVYCRGGGFEFEALRAEPAVGGMGDHGRSCDFLEVSAGRIDANKLLMPEAPEACTAMFETESKWWVLREDCTETCCTLNYLNPQIIAQKSGKP